MSLGKAYYIERLNLWDVSEANAFSPISATTTLYGSQSNKKREILGAKFFGETAVTGDTLAKYDIGLWVSGVRVANLAFNTSTDHTANTYTDLTLTTTDSGNTNHYIAADTTMTCGCVKTGSPSALHTNSWLEIEVAVIQTY